MVCTRKFPEELTAHLTIWDQLTWPKGTLQNSSNTSVTELSLPVTFKSYPWRWCGQCPLSIFLPMPYCTLYLVRTSFMWHMWTALQSDVMDGLASLVQYVQSGTRWSQQMWHSQSTHTTLSWMVHNIKIHETSTWQVNINAMLQNVDYLDCSTLWWIWPSQTQLARRSIIIVLVC